MYYYDGKAVPREDIFGKPNSALKDDKKKK